MKSYSKIIYVAGKFQNNHANKEHIEKCCRVFQQHHPDFLFINGVSQFSHMNKDVDYYTGLSMCLALLKKSADEVWTVGDYSDSIGTNVELFVAEENHIPVKLNMDKVLNVK